MGNRGDDIGKRLDAAAIGAMAAAAVLVVLVIIGRPAGAESLPPVSTPTVPTTVASPVPVRVPTSTHLPVPPAPTVSGGTAPITPVAPASVPGVSPSPTPTDTAKTGSPRVGGTRPVTGSARARPRSSPATVARIRPNPGVPAVNRRLPARLQRAAYQTARDLSFPLGLALAFAVFLVVHHRIDKNDPRMAGAGLTADDDSLGFS